MLLLCLLLIHFYAGVTWLDPVGHMVGLTCWRSALRPLFIPDPSYADACYQKNIDHRKRFAHPGDADYRAPGKPASAAGKRRRTAPVSYAGAESGSDDDETDADGAAFGGGGTDSESENGWGGAAAPPAKRAARADSGQRTSSTKPDASAVSDAADVGLADVFTDMTFFVSSKDAEKHTLTRLAVAFDGDVVHTDDSSLTHILVDSLDPNTWTDDVKAVVAAHPGEERR